MTKFGKLLAQVISGRSDTNIDFDGLRNLFPAWFRGAGSSRHIFIRPGVEDLINLQREGRMAKPYQVRQVRSVITTYSLTAGEDK